jgi:3-dehydroquinate dehydratase
LLLSLIPSVSVLADQVKANQAYKEDAAGTIRVAFSPNGGATKLVTDTIHQAKKQILVQAYSFTSPAIAKALADAKARGVDVEVILDKSQWTEKYSGATYLVNHRVPVLIDGKHARGYACEKSTCSRRNLASRSPLPAGRLGVAILTAPFRCRTAASSRCRAAAVPSGPFAVLERKGRRKTPLSQAG